MKKICKAALMASLALGACTSQPTYEKQVVFPENATLEQKIEMASHLVPTPQQLEWQKLEFTCFLHFGMNTFTGNEWGTGQEDPALFNPTELDCEQWVKALKDGGFKMAIITAKHHDGFCLWQTKTTDHSVASSPWKDGKGDVVRELRDACEKYGLKFGVYLSPWDRHAPCYGDSPAYNAYFIEQLTELLTNYGEVHEVWFDGANGEGPNGKKQEYDWDAVLATIRRLQPKAVTAIMGDDVRWVGNEGGMGRTTEWSAAVITPGSYTSIKQNEELGIKTTMKEICTRDHIAKASRMYWYPSEVDVSIRPGWFYHADQDNRVRSLANLVDIYLQSVGRNSTLLLNIPPDTRGLIHENDVQRLKELAQYLEKAFANDLVVNGNKSWQANGAGVVREFALKECASVNTILLQEDIAKGQQMEGFYVEGRLANGEWIRLTNGTTIGNKRIIRFPEIQIDRLRITVTSTRGKSTVVKVGAYLQEVLMDETVRQRFSDVSVKDWICMTEGAEAAIDGTRNTAWKAEGLQSLTVDMGAEYTVSGFCYAPVMGDDLQGTIYKYRFLVSTDGTNWTPCEGRDEFSNIMHNPIPYNIYFEQSYKARYFRLEPVEEINGEAFTSIAEVGILTE